MEKETFLDKYGLPILAIAFMVAMVAFLYYLDNVI